MTVRGNVLLPEASATSRGSSSAPGLAHNVVVEDNFIHTRMYNGVASASGASEITVTGNTLINMMPGRSTAISAPAGSTVTENIITKYYKAAGMHGAESLDPDREARHARLCHRILSQRRQGPRPEARRPRHRPRQPRRGRSAPPAGCRSCSAWRLPELPSAPTSTETVYSLAGAHDFGGHAADVVSVAPSAKLALDAATIAFRFEADKVQGRHGLVTRDADGLDRRRQPFRRDAQNGRLTVKFESATTWIEFSTAASGHKEYDVQAAFGDGKVYAWLNGTLIGSAEFDTDWTGNQQYLQVGAHNGKIPPSGTAGFDRMFDGTISDLKIVDGLVAPTALAAVGIAGRAAAAERAVRHRRRRRTRSGRGPARPSSAAG